MHVYIYDSFVNHKKYNNILARIETRLTDLGLNGKICRLGAMKNIREMVKSELSRGAKTIVAVGNDQTVSQVLNALAQSTDPAPYQKTLNPTPPMGIIPVNGENNSIAAALGIGPGEEACETLSARRVEKLDLGMANDAYFLSTASITNQGTVVTIKNYSVELLEEGEINIINLPPKEMVLPREAIFNPQDGFLDLLIQTKKNKKRLFAGAQEMSQSVFPVTLLSLSNDRGRPLLLDGSLEVRSPAEIKLIKKKLNIIVGKERNF